MASGYDCMVSVSLGKNVEWIPSEMKFNDLHQGWDITISKQGVDARRKMPQEPTETESAQFEKELKEVAIRLSEALTYLMNVRTTRSEPRPSEKVMVTGPGHISITAEMLSATYSLTVYGPPPTVSGIQEFWRDLETDPSYREVVSLYLRALESTSESEVATELYKALEVVEIQYRGERNAHRKLGYSSAWWRNLNHNLNWGRRHVGGNFQRPKQRMSANESINAVREIIEKFRRRQQRDAQPV